MGGNYKKIILTNAPDDLKPWFLLLRKSDYGNLVFSSDKCPSSEFIIANKVPYDGVLFVDNEGCVPQIRLYGDYQLIDVISINRPDGSSPFWLRRLRLIRRI